MGQVLCQNVADGIRWSAGLVVPEVIQNSYPAQVINLSLGGYGACSQTMQNAISEVVSLRKAVVVVAAGNESSDVRDFLPANCLDVITVAATDRNGGKAWYSNYGIFISISAPGGDTTISNSNGILSTLNSGTQSPKPSPSGDTYRFYQGTSMAAPHVSGVVSLMLSVDPSLTPAKILEILKRTARSFPVSRPCDIWTCGAGILDAYAAVQAVIPQPTMVDLSVNITAGSGTVSGPGISCPGDCSERLVPGTKITLTATFGPSQKFGGWGGACAGQGNPCTLTVNSATSVTASFIRDPNQALVSVAIEGQGTVSGTGISCPGNCSEYYQVGTPITLTASPSVGWKFEGWTGDCAGQGNICSLTVTGDLNTKANFNPNLPVDLSVSITGSGSVSGNGIACPSDCSEPLTPGTKITLTATPGPGQKFGVWGGACTGQGNPCTLTVNSSTSVTANFIRDPNQALVSVVIEGQGNVSGTGINCPGDCSEYYQTGTQITLNATASNGEQFKGWAGACEGQGNPCSLTVTGDLDIKARFTDALNWLPPILNLILED